MNADQRGLRFRFLLLHLCLSAFICGHVLAADEPAPQVVTMRVPDGGAQPQIALGAGGVVHMIYCKGDAKASDIYYIRSNDGEKFSDPVRVNSQEGSAATIGTIRGPQLAVGKNGRVHVAWIGSDSAKPQAASHQLPMLYSRLGNDGKFEPQRSVMHSAGLLDGGSSVAADESGNVYIVLHALPKGQTPEETNRRVFIVKSADEGKTFDPEQPVSGVGKGVCACCSLRAAVDGEGRLHILYRSAASLTARNMRWLVSGNGGKTFSTTTLDEWQINVCPMSSCFISFTPGGAPLLGWEHMKHVVYYTTSVKDEKTTQEARVNLNIENSKHPAIATNAKGQTCLVWTHSTGWNKPGTAMWVVTQQPGVLEKDIKTAQAPGVPVWSFAAVYARPDGRFVVVY